MRSLSRLLARPACSAALLIFGAHAVAADAPPTDVKGKVAEKWQSLGPCAKGAIAGGVAGQVLGGRMVLGALAGCGGAKVLAAKKQAEAKSQLPPDAPKAPQRPGDGVAPPAPVPSPSESPEPPPNDEPPLPAPVPAPQ